MNTDLILDSIYNMIIRSPLGKQGNTFTVISGFICSGWWLKNKRKSRLTEYLDENFYRPLGLQHTTFNPLNKFPLSRSFQLKTTRSSATSLSMDTCTTREPQCWEGFRACRLVFNRLRPCSDYANAYTGRLIWREAVLQTRDRQGVYERPVPRHR